MSMGAAAHVSPNERARSLAVLSQLAVFCGSILVPGVIRLTAGRKNAFTRHWATEALNLQFAALFAWGLLFVAVLIDSSFLFGVLLPLMLVWALYTVVISIVGAVKSWDGQVWRYPVNLRIFR